MNSIIVDNFNLIVPIIIVIQKMYQKCLANNIYEFPKIKKEFTSKIISNNVPSQHNLYKILYDLYFLILIID